MISTQRKRLKMSLLAILIIIILAIIIILFYNNGYLELIKNAIQGQKTEKNIIDGISIDGVELTYDSSSNTYYFPVNLKDEDNTLKIKIKSNYFIKSKIEDKEFGKQIKVSENIDYDKVIEIEIETWLYKDSYTIKLTNLPTISLTFNQDEIGTEYTYAGFTITDPDYKENGTKQQYYSDAKTRYRGSSTAGYPKKSYRIKLDKNIDIGLLGMDPSRTWILDSLVTDPSCLRTKLASDIWNRMNTDLNDEEHANLNAKFVELYVNGEYAGLYLLKETIDEELLDLDKDTGVLIKGVDWNLVDFNNYNNVQSETFGPFEMKYPKKASKYSEAWKNILDKMKRYYTGDISYEALEENFYVENAINHKIFLLITQATDNYEFKNIYFSIANNKEATKVLITPWDLDLTFGLLWSEEKLNYVEQYARIEEIVETYSKSDDETTKAYKERWKVLSEKALNKEKINNLIDEQYEYLRKAGALERENEKNKNNENMQNEKDWIKNWYDKRFDVIDQYINSL